MLLVQGVAFEVETELNPQGSWGGCDVLAKTGVQVPLIGGGGEGSFRTLVHGESKAACADCHRAASTPRPLTRSTANRRFGRL